MAANELMVPPGSFGSDSSACHPTNPVACIDSDSLTPKPTSSPPPPPDAARESTYATEYAGMASIVHSLKSARALAARRTTPTTMATRNTANHLRPSGSTVK